MLVHVGSSFAASSSFLAQDSRSLRFLCCSVLVFFSFRVAPHVCYAHAQAAFAPTLCWTGVPDLLGMHDGSSRRYVFFCTLCLCWVFQHDALLSLPVNSCALVFGSHNLGHSCPSGSRKIQHSAPPCFCQHCPALPDGFIDWVVGPVLPHGFIEWVVGPVLRDGFIEWVVLREARSQRFTWS